MTALQKILGPSGDWLVSREALDSKAIAHLCDRIQGIGAAGLVTVTDHVQGFAATGDPLSNQAEAVRIAASVDDADSFRTISGTYEVKRSGTMTGVKMHQQASHPSMAASHGSDSLVMAEGLADPRPGLSVECEGTNVLVALGESGEATSVDATILPNVDPAPERYRVGFLDLASAKIIETQTEFTLHVADTQPAEVGALSVAAVQAIKTWSGAEQLEQAVVHTANARLEVLENWSFAKTQHVFSAEFSEF